MSRLFTGCSTRSWAVHSYCCSTNSSGAGIVTNYQALDVLGVHKVHGSEPRTWPPARRQILGSLAARCRQRSPAQMDEPVAARILGQSMGAAMRVSGARDDGIIERLQEYKITSSLFPWLCRPAKRRFAPTSAWVRSLSSFSYSAKMAETNKSMAWRSKSCAEGKC